MTAYVITTIGTLTCSTAATLFAAAGYNREVAILAGIATVLIGVKKSLLFREKWRLHLSIDTRLQISKARIEFTK
jgi:hypothetical protein